MRQRERGRRKERGGKGRASDDDSEEVDEEEDAEDTVDAMEGDEHGKPDSEAEEDEDERDAILPSDIRNHLVQPRKGKKNSNAPARPPSRAAVAVSEMAPASMSQSQVPGTPVSQVLASAAGEGAGEDAGASVSKSQGRRLSGGPFA